MQKQINASSSELEVSSDHSNARFIDQRVKSFFYDFLTSIAWVRNIKRCAFLAFLLILIVFSSLLISYTNSELRVHLTSKQSDTQPDEFNFLVYCLLSYYTQDKMFKPSKLQQNDNKGEMRRRLMYPSEYSNVT